LGMKLTSARRHVACVFSSARGICVFKSSVNSKGKFSAVDHITSQLFNQLKGPGARQMGDYRVLVNQVIQNGHLAAAAELSTYNLMISKQSKWRRGLCVWHAHPAWCCGYSTFEYNSPSNGINLGVGPSCVLCHCAMRHLGRTFIVRAW